MNISAWQSINTLPTESGLYLIHAPSADPEKPLIAIAFFDLEFGWDGLVEVWLKAIKHWMPLPDPPK